MNCCISTDEPFSLIPSLNLNDTGNTYIITIDMPGADPSTLKTELKDGQLTVTMKTTEDRNEQQKNYYRQERFRGTFKRSLTLPGPVKESAMKTDYHDGVLTITIPKA
jgi:HSP20 family protein